MRGVSTQSILVVRSITPVAAGDASGRTDPRPVTQPCAASSPHWRTLVHLPVEPAEIKVRDGAQERRFEFGIVEITAVLALTALDHSRTHQPAPVVPSLRASIPESHRSAAATADEPVKQVVITVIAAPACSWLSRTGGHIGGFARCPVARVMLRKRDAGKYGSIRRRRHHDQGQNRAGQGSVAEGVPDRCRDLSRLIMCRSVSDARASGAALDDDPNRRHLAAGW